MEKLNSEVSDYLIQSRRIAQILIHLGNGLASLLHNIDRDLGADWLYSQIYPLQKRLAELEPEHHEVKLAEVSCGYGRVLRSLRRYEEADALFAFALNVYIKKFKFSRNVSDVYRLCMATTCNDMGLLRYDTGEYNEAEKMYQFARKILRSLSQEYPDTYNFELAEVYENSGINEFYGRKNPQRARALFRSAYHLVAGNPRYRVKSDELSRLVGICASRNRTHSTE